MLVATWNVEWAAPKRRASITERLASLDADVLVITEGVRSVVPPGGHIALGGTEWGIQAKHREWRKVLMWSRYPLSDVTTYEEMGLPPGRIVAATSQTPDGPIRVIGVCIPWFAAHVATGRRDAVPWQEHLQFVDGLGTLLRERSSPLPLVVMGDYNQTIPRTRAPLRVSAALEEALSPLHVLTAGDIPGLPAGTIDHIAVTPGLEGTDVFGIARVNDSGKPLSDHDLVAAHLATGG